jgi:hypothetical protein
MVESPLHPRVIELDAKSTDMRTKRKHREMLRFMEEALALRVTSQGRMHPDVNAAAERLVKDYNAVAMQLLREGAPSPRMPPTEGESGNGARDPMCIRGVPRAGEGALRLRTIVPGSSHGVGRR